MDTNRDKPVGMDGTPYIWLRYTTQFTTGGRTHTIEMGIPVPIGASQETREQLIREAEAGMAQLSQRVESRVAQMVQRNTLAASPGTRAEEPARAQTSSAGSARPTGGNPAPAGLSPQPRPQPAPQAERPQTPPAVPQTRPTVGANMPSSPAGDNAGSMKLSQFLQIIRERWSMSAKEAMDLLQVRNLNGLNYRDTLRRLQIEREGTGATSAGKPTQQIPTTGPARPGSAPTPLRNNVNQAAPAAEPATPAPSPAKPSQAAPASQSAARPAPAPEPPSRTAPRPTPLNSSATGPKAESAAPEPPAPSSVRRANTDEVAGSPKAPIPIQTGVVRTMPRVYKFEEEEDEEDEKNEKDEQDEELDLPDDDKDFQRITAQSKLDELKDIRGNINANAARLTVLHNVLNSQISDEQLQKIIQTTWGAASEKKLKVEQVEALISWAKEDFFVEEAEAVLALIDEEETYARSDR